MTCGGDDIDEELRATESWRAGAVSKCLESVRQVDRNSSEVVARGRVLLVVVSRVPLLISQSFATPGEGSQLVLDSIHGCRTFSSRLLRLSGSRTVEKLFRSTDNVSRGFADSVK